MVCYSYLQTIANVTLDEKHTYILYPILYVKKIIISADIIQFGEQSNLYSSESMWIKQDKPADKSSTNVVETEPATPSDEVLVTKGNTPEYEKDGELVIDRYNNGQVKQKGYRVDGEWDGLARWWYENSQLRIEANYKDGKLDGLRRWWRENGQLGKEDVYKDGKVISRKEWDRANNLTKDETY